MRPSAHFFNVARGRVCVAAALAEALAEGRIADEALGCKEAEPLTADSPLWAVPNVLITPHTAGETRRYEDNVIDLLLENLDRLRRRESELMNQIVRPLVSGPAGRTQATPKATDDRPGGWPVSIGGTWARSATRRSGRRCRRADGRP